MSYFSSREGERKRERERLRGHLKATRIINICKKLNNNLRKHCFYCCRYVTYTYVRWACIFIKCCPCCRL